MISKIDRFKVYKDTLAEYRKIQTINWRMVDLILEIKKEAADKLITYIVSDSLNEI